MGLVAEKAVDIGFALKKQADIKTPLAAADFNKRLPFREFGIARLEQQKLTNKAQFGKDTAFATELRRSGQSFAASYSFDLTSLSASWALALLMGSVVTDQPEGTGVAAWRHLVKFRNFRTDPRALATSYLEKVGGEETRLLSGVVFQEVTIQAATKFDLQLAMTLLCRKSQADSTAIPSTSASKFLKTTKVMIGPKGSPTDRTNEVSSWSLTVRQAVEPVRWQGEPAADELLVSDFIVTDQAATLQIQLQYDDVVRNWLRDGAELECTITSEGDTVAGAQKHTAEFHFPRLFVAAEDVPRQTGLQLYQLNFDEESVLHDATAGYSVQAKLINDLSNILA